jgi:hypothetical protein
MLAYVGDIAGQSMMFVTAIRRLKPQRVLEDARPLA